LQFEFGFCAHGAHCQGTIAYREAQIISGVITHAVDGVCVLKGRANMARKNKGPQALDVLVDLVARFPWWVGVLLAIASYVVLHEVANTKPPPISGMGQLSEMVTRSFVAGLAYVGQYFLPFVLVVGAIMSFVHRRRAGQFTGYSAATRHDHLPQPLAAARH
jgi:hypothetical protein